MSQPRPCNNPDIYLQNRASGNCLFESVAQIFYNISFGGGNDEQYGKIDDLTDILRICKRSC